MSELWSSLKFDSPTQTTAWEDYTKTVPKKKGLISSKATSNVKYLELLKLTDEDVQKESTQLFLKSKKDTLKAEINGMSNDFDLLMDEVVSFLMSLEGVDESSVKTIELIKKEIEE